ncbi:MAG: hypothetical protein GY811_20325 [Myxococcales bacterium]|nr:hypothetical protein [Myxococcales bacterium]
MALRCLPRVDCAGSHGGEAEISCEAPPDTGELTLPAHFLDALDDADWSRGECGSHEVIRYDTDSVACGNFRFESHALASFFYRP